MREHRPSGRVGYKPGGGGGGALPLWKKLPTAKLPPPSFL